MTTTASGPITISGLASGLNTSSIISQLVTSESSVNTGLESTVSTLQNQLTAWQTFNSDLLTLQDASTALSTSSLYTGVQATSSDTSVATASTSNGAVAGNHTLTVTSLAASQEVLSQSFTSATSQVGASGTISLNGTQITINSTQTLSSIASSINNADAGVTASVLNIGTGDSVLSLASTNTGTVNAISASDISGNALETLGLVPSSSQTTGIRQLTGTSTDSVAGSIALASGTTAIGTQIGYAVGAAPSGSFSIDGTSIGGIDLNTDSLTDVANAINQADISGITAQVVPTSDGGTTSGPQQLEITSSSGTLSASDFSDPDGILSSLGVTQTNFSDQVSTAADAQFSLDNVDYTRSSNTVSDALPDTTLGLVSDGTTNISITQNTSAITTAVQSFVTAYNAVNDYVNTQFTFTPNTSTETNGTAQSSPPLFGNQTLTSTQQQLASAVTVASGGLSLQSIGLTVGQTGDLSLNSSTLTTELASNASGVANLFGQTGSTTNSAVQYVTAGANTLATSAGYAVDITQPATQAVITGSSPFASTLAQPETLTFSGTSFPEGNISLTLSQGNTLAQTIAQINDDNQLNSSITASQDSNGDLVLTSNGYGSSQAFSVVSNQSGTGTSGIGTTTLSSSGLDVAGTLNGEPATGDGQTLIGNNGNANTDGLELNITATAPGNYGTVSVTNGIAAGLGQLLNNITNSSTGSIAAAETAVNSSITTDQAQEKTNDTTISNYQSQLETEFANMETQVAKLQAQGNAMTAEVAGWADSGSTSTASTSTPTVSGSSSSSSSS
jgi:flagellar hook-associated protein 2